MQERLRDTQKPSLLVAVAAIIACVATAVALEDYHAWVIGSALLALTAVLVYVANRLFDSGH
jgi:uncharacterized membrane protein YhaH (DUF805 family)